MTESDAAKITQQADQPEVPTPEKKEKPAAAKRAAANEPAKRSATVKKTVKSDKSVKSEKAPAPIDLDSPTLYTNREISWIEFDRKVLETAEDHKVPQQRAADRARQDAARQAACGNSPPCG